MSELAVKQENNLKAIMRSSEIMTRFAEVVGNNGAGGYVSSVLIAVSQNDKLQECSPNSIIACALRAATMRLSVDPATGQAYLVPFKGKATLVIGYKGIYQMALRTNKYRFINLIDIYESDVLIENPMTGNIVLQRGDTQLVPGKHRGEGAVVGYMLYFEMTNGFTKTIYMTNEECDAHGAKYSKNYAYEGKPNKDSMWHKDPPAMFKKTVMRMGLLKWGYLDPFDMLAIKEDTEEVDYLEGVEIQEVKPHSVDENMRALGFGDDATPQDEPEPIEEKADEPVKITSKMFWEMAKAVNVSNVKGQDILNNAGGDFDAAYTELKKLSK